MKHTLQTDLNASPTLELLSVGHGLSGVDADLEVTGDTEKRILEISTPMQTLAIKADSKIDFFLQLHCIGQCAIAVANQMHAELGREETAPDLPRKNNVVPFNKEDEGFYFGDKGECAGCLGKFSYDDLVRCNTCHWDFCPNCEDMRDRTCSECKKDKEAES